jgi:SAM-dependent methyltransferase
MDTTCLPAPAQLYQHFYVPSIFEPLARLLVDLAPPRTGAHVLDLACGTGVVARRAAQLIGNRGRVLAVDVSPSMLAVARSAPLGIGAPIEFIEADAVTSIFPVGHFDAAYCQQGIQFFSDRAVVLGRVRLALRAGAPLALAVWQGIEHQPLFAAFAEVEARHLAGLGVGFDDIITPFSFGDPAQIHALLADAGFERIALTQQELQVRFAGADTFARRMETAFAAVVPAFVEDTARFAAFVAAVERDTRDIVQRATVGDEVRFGMRTNLAVAYAP